MTAEIFIPLVVAFIIIIIQFNFFLRTYLQIKDLRNLFPEVKKPSPFKIITQEFSSNNTQQNTSIENNSNKGKSNNSAPKIIADNYEFSFGFQEIIDAINTYLQKNFGIIADFEILKSIVERRVEVEDDNIVHSINRPLYLGLMGTFIGVIIGIGFFLAPVFFSDKNLSATINDQGIQGFLGGVGVSMIASFCGLILTTYNNSKNFKEARNEVNKRKNFFYNFLQTELLPEMNRDLQKNISSLNKTLEEFNRSFSTVLMRNLDEFNQKFEKNMNLFAGQMNLINTNITTQKEFLERIEKLGIKKIVEANLEIFKNITDNQALFYRFYEYAATLNKSIENSVKVGEIITALLNRISNFEDSINNLAKEINSKGNILTDLGNAIKEYFQLIEKYKNAIEQHFNISADNISDYFAKLEEKLRGHSQTFIEILDNMSTSFHEQLNKVSKLMNNLTSETSDKIAQEISNLSSLLANLIEDAGKKVFQEIEKSFGDKVLENLNMIGDINKKLQSMEEIKPQIDVKIPDIHINFTPILESLEKLHSEISLINQKLSPSAFSFKKWLQSVFRFFRKSSYENIDFPYEQNVSDLSNKSNVNSETISNIQTISTITTQKKNDDNVKLKEDTVNSLSAPKQKIITEEKPSSTSEKKTTDNFVRKLYYCSLPNPDGGISFDKCSETPEFSSLFTIETLNEHLAKLEIYDKSSVIKNAITDYKTYLEPLFILENNVSEDHSKILIKEPAILKLDSNKWVVRKKGIIVLQ